MFADALIARGDSSKKLPLCLCVRVLRAVASLAEERVQQNLCDQDAIGLLLGKPRSAQSLRPAAAGSVCLMSPCVLSEFLMQIEAGPEGDDVLSLEIKADVQVILSLLCESDMHRKVRLRLRPQSSAAASAFRGFSF